MRERNPVSKSIAEAQAGALTGSGPSVPRLRVTGLSKTFTVRPALDSFSLTIRAGEVHALVGENGSGKTTLIKILSGYHSPDPGGEVLVDGERLKLGSAHASTSAGLRFVHQDLGLIDQLSVLDNLCLNTGFVSLGPTIRVRENRRRAVEDLARVGLDLDPRVLVRTLPPAVRTGIAVARALRQPAGHEPARVLVLDEPTATLPYNEVEQLLAMVRSVSATGVGILYVTHRLDEIFEIAHNLTVLRDGRTVAERPVGQLDRRQLVSLLVGDEFADAHAASTAIERAAPEPVFVVDDVTTDTVESVSFGVGPGEILGVAGITGSGRESLLAALFGGSPRPGGTVTMNDKPVRAGRPDLAMAAGIAFLPPDRKTQGAVLGLTARENLVLGHLTPYWSRGLLRRRRERDEARVWFERLSVRPSTGIEQPLSTFSGGNQQKILFGKWLRRGPLVLLLDEPTQGVDVGAKAELHAQIVAAAAGGAAVVVSSTDADELVALCHRVLVLRGGRIVADLSGDALTVARLSEASLGVDLENQVKEPTR
jgi:ribose transport system ATP-binding protein